MRPMPVEDGLQKRYRWAEKAMSGAVPDDIA
jgi:hypothetical protein